MDGKLSSSSHKFLSKDSTDSKELNNYWCPCNGTEKPKFQESESEDKIPEEVEVEKKSVWQTILEESEKRDAPYIAWLKEREEPEEEDVDSQASYLNREIFPVLLPAMEETLRKARQWNALDVQKCRFNGLDYLAEYLWNKNPRWPKRRNIGWLEAFDIPQFKLSLRLKPRPIFPKSWLLSPEEAAVYIQRWIRGWLVRKREDVQELRQFWKAIAADKETMDEGHPKISRDSRISNLCERYKIKGFQ